MGEGALARAWSVGALIEQVSAIRRERLLRRVGVATAVYVGAALLVLLAVIVARRQLTADSLRAFLAYLVISTISSGLEPGTVKTLAVTHGAGAEPPIPAVLLASMLKAIAAAPFLAVVWRLSEPGVSPRTLLLSPLIAIAGFSVTDLRVLLDLRGRHAAAIGFKQLSASAGAVITAGLMILGMTAFWAILVACVMRLALVAPFARGLTPWRRTFRSAWAMLADLRWLEFAGASILSSAGGSVDRIVAIRFLSAAALGSYYVVFEMFSRFWLLPYLLTPILFARRVNGEPSEGFLRLAWGTTALAGAAFLAGLAALTALDPRILEAVIGRPLDLASLGLAGAILIASFGQLRVAELQAGGRTRRVVYLLVFSLVCSAAIFWIAAREAGVRGLMWAWLAKAFIELVATYVGKRHGRARQHL
jgi:hypothetical protein